MENRLFLFTTSRYDLNFYRRLLAFRQILCRGYGKPFWIYTAVLQLLFNDFGTLPGQLMKLIFADSDALQDKTLQRLFNDWRERNFRICSAAESEDITDPAERRGNGSHDRIANGTPN